MSLRLREPNVLGKQTRLNQNAEFWQEHSHKAEAVKLLLVVLNSCFKNSPLYDLCQALFQVFVKKIAVLVNPSEGRPKSFFKKCLAIDIKGILLDRYLSCLLVFLTPVIR